MLLCWSGASTASSCYGFHRTHFKVSCSLFCCATGYFTLWFAINALYNIANKQTLQKLPLPWLISSVQLVVGSIYIGLVWALKMRPAPELNKEEFKVSTLPHLSNDTSARLQCYCTHIDKRFASLHAAAHCVRTIYSCDALRALHALRWQC
jgi:Triose-phosphate Transporter family